MANRDEVKVFLNKFRTTAGNPENLILTRMYPSSKNTTCLIALGMTEKEAKMEIFKICIEDYSTGPEDDRDRKGQEVWGFCHKVFGKDIYIKLVLTKDGKAKILSFHFPEYPMNRPLTIKQ